ncbi:hypothetical protein MRX96_027265 [Rhipicephalus microplus]
MQAMIRFNPSRYSRGRGLSQSYSTYFDASPAPDFHPHNVGHKRWDLVATISEGEVETSNIFPSHAKPAMKWEHNVYF